MKQNFMPVETFPPGEFISEEMQERGWTPSDLAEILGWPLQKVGDILSAKQVINFDISKELADVFGVSSSFFLNLENAYRSM